VCVPLQIYVFCCAHAAQVEAYLRDCHWLSERHCKARRHQRLAGDARIELVNLGTDRQWCLRWTLAGVFRQSLPLLSTSSNEPSEHAHFVLAVSYDTCCLHRIWRRMMSWP